ncbi:PilZ domain-containing protein [Desulfuromonas acetexigens]|uniref:PilZ domain-containing protein n=1 Tax=Trichloromonas acetexigens TaxID=38815 RepID=A0A550JGP7_9BACT|nr:PilZ domain-containing protein [Desulfuromonas acetexigens]TRO82385.1 PilZ domain-containing protein [Desulfuromonas acetexigens]
MFSPDVLALLEDFRVARVALPTAEGERTLECAIRFLPPDGLEARFLAGELADIPLAAESLLRVFCEAGLSTFSIQARVEKVLDEHLLRLRIEGGSSHGDTRHHFRVDTRVNLRFWPVGGNPPTAGESLEVNLSNGGMRFTTAAPLELGQLLAVEIGLPGAEEAPVSASGRVVGVWRKDGQGHEVVVKFTELASEQLNRLSEFCLGLKFRKMCERVEFLGSLLKPRPPEE